MSDTAVLEERNIGHWYVMKHGTVEERESARAHVAAMSEAEWQAWASYKAVTDGWFKRPKPKPKKRGLWSRIRKSLRTASRAVAKAAPKIVDWAWRMIKTAPRFLQDVVSLRKAYLVTVAAFT